MGAVWDHTTFYLKIELSDFILMSDFEKFLLAGFSASLIFQIFINISTVIGIIPVTGMPFPLLSLGGSSIVATAVIFGIINRIFIENNVVI